MIYPQNKLTHKSIYTTHLQKSDFKKSFFSFKMKFNFLKSLLLMIITENLDAAPCHIVAPAMEVLRSMFGDRIIKINTHIAQPADSPDI